jgi:ParB family transcriptional regulator, chromosome partitioning protein
VNQTVAKPGVRLGRGLSALLGDYAGARNAIDGADPGATASPANEHEPAPPTSELPLDAIVPNPKQPRRTFVEEQLEELAESIRTKGVLQAILVRPDPERAGQFEIVAGERRWRAARRAGLTTIPTIVRELDDRETLEIGIIENVQRADLNAIEEAEAYRALMDRFGRTQESVGAQVGKSREHVANTLRLLNLPDDVRSHVKDGKLSAGHARALLKSEAASELAGHVISKGLSVRETEALVRAQPKPEGAPASSTPGPIGAGGVRPASERKDVDTKALELDLQRALGLDVDIRHVNEKGGEVRIKYARLEQLDEICRLLSRPTYTRLTVPAPGETPDVAGDGEHVPSGG